MPKISVIVPIYNAENGLSRCVDSILRQTFMDYELILVDDGSKDTSLQICNEFAKQDSRIRVIHQENAGVSAARNRGLEVSTGEYLMFVDSDDTIDESFFKEALEEIEENNADIYISGLAMETWLNGNVIKSVDYRAKTSKIYTTKTLFEDLEINYPQICICGPTCKLYKRNLIIDNNIRFKEGLNCGEDTYFNLNVFERKPRIFMTDKYYYHYYRGNEDSLFSRYREDVYEIHCLVYDYMRMVMKNNNCSDIAMESFETIYANLAIGSISHYYEHKDKTTRKLRYKMIKKVFSNEYLLHGRKNYNTKRNKALHWCGKHRLYIIAYIILNIYYNKFLRNIAKRINRRKV